MGKVWRALVLCVIVGCSSGTDAPVTQGDAATESPRAGVYPSEHVGGGPLCGWVPLPRSDGDGGTVWVEEFLPCGEVTKDPVSDPPMDEGPAVDVPKGWSPPGAPGDPVPW